MDEGFAAHFVASSSKASSSSPNSVYPSAPAQLCLSLRLLRLAGLARNARARPRSHHRPMVTTIRELSPPEQAYLCTRLTISGMTERQIGQLLGWTTVEVRHRLALARLLEPEPSVGH